MSKTKGAGSTKNGRESESKRLGLKKQAREDAARNFPRQDADDLSAADLAAQWLPRLGATPRMAVDLSQVTEMDGAGLQLLLMVQREAPKAGTELTVTGQSKAVTETLALCNLVA